MRLLKDKYPRNGDKPHRNAPTAVRFWRMVLLDEPEKCWNWAASLGGSGYGQFWNREIGRTGKSHRYSYEYFNGEIPKGLEILHACDNRACVNPHHLSVGTRKDNVRDAVERDRVGFGFRKKATKLSPHQARVVFFSKGVLTGRKMAKEFGVNAMSISQVRNGKTHTRPVLRATEQELRDAHSHISKILDYDKKAEELAETA